MGIPENWRATDDLLRCLAPHFISRRSLFVRLANLLATAVSISLICCRPVLGGDTAKKAGPSRPFGIDKRVPWNSSKIIGTPEPPPPYRTAQVFSKLKFSEPLAMASVPGSNRLLVVERRGKIYAFENSPTVEKA